MVDTASEWLTQAIRHAPAQPGLWFCDENPLQALQNLSNLIHKPRLISNRWDVAQTAKSLGFEAGFSDFDTREIADNSQARIFYRISKEKPLVHYLINQAWRLLQPEGELVICGEKNQGIKTYVDKAAKLFGCKAELHKAGICYHASLKRSNNNPDGLWLDEQHYNQLRSIHTRQLNFFSKPGLFGWNKTDQGSALLVQHLPDLLNGQPIHSMLDLGCGYGYLTLMTAQLPFNQRVATDNNAAALLAMRANAANTNLEVTVIAGDAGSEVQGHFDLILCNPPFHQGFDMNGDLTDKFLMAAQRLLAPKGLVVFVVNQFIPLERKASRYFQHVQWVTQGQGFKVILLKGA